MDKRVLLIITGDKKYWGAIPMTIENAMEKINKLELEVEMLKITNERQEKVIEVICQTLKMNPLL